MRYERVADKIVIEQSRKGAIILVVIFLIIIVGWQWVVFGMPKNLDELRALDKGFVGKTGINPIFFMVAGLPLFLMPSLIRNLRVALVGRIIVIDGTAKKIFKNGKELLRFSDIQNLNFKYMEDSTIWLDFILHSGKKIKLGNIGDLKNMDTYKADIREVIQFSEKTLDEMPRKDSFGTVFAIIHYIILIISILLLIGSAYAIASSVLFTFLSTTTTGKVIDIDVETIERIEDSGRVGRPKKKVRTTSTVYTSTIEYKDNSGTVHTFKTSAVATGGMVPVVYLKFLPQFARVKSFSGMWGAFVILLIFGVLLFFVSQLFNEKFFEKIKKKKKNIEHRPQR